MNRWAWVGEDNPAQDLGLRILAHAIRRRRVTSGISQMQLAYRVGLNQSTISRLETGRLRAMRMVTLARVIGALNLPPGDLSPDEPPPPRRRMPGQE